MTTRRIVVLVCQGCGTTSLPPGLTLLDAVNMEHPPPDSVVDARSDARLKEWIHDKLGRDFCGNCRAFKPPKDRQHKIRIPHPRW